MPGPRLDNKVAIITGGSSGFGAGIVKKFVEEGCKVLIFDLHPPPSYGTTTSIPITTTSSTSSPSHSLDPTSNSKPENISVFIGDVSRASDWAAALTQTLTVFGKVDIVINNAGVVHTACPSENLREEELERMWRVNVTPVFLSTKTLVPYWQERAAQQRKDGEGGKSTGGVVVNLSSISAVRPRPGLVGYAASKGGVTAATRGLAAEYAKEGIRYCCIQPVLGETGMVAPVLGGVDTPEGRAGPLAGIPLGRLSTPRDVANAACFLASDEAEFLTGVCLDVDGGRSLM